MSTPTQVEFLRHELLDRTSNLLTIVEQQLSQHMSLEAHNQAFTPRQLAYVERRVSAITDELGKLYQFIGNIHL